MFCKLMTLAEQSLDVFLGEMDVMCGDFDEERLLLLCFKHVHEVGSAQGRYRLACHHSFFVSGNDKNGYFGVIRRDAADFIEPSGVAISLVVDGHAHAVEALQRQRPYHRASLTNSAREQEGIQSSHSRDV